MKHVATILLAGLLAALPACGSNEALKRHSLAAETLEDLAVQSREAVTEVRETRLRAAGVAARDAGGDIETAVRGAAAEFDSGPLIPAVNTFILAKSAYVRAVLIAAQDDAPSFAELRPVLRAALDAYGELRRAVGDAAALPEVPDVVLALLTYRDVKPLDFDDPLRLETQVVQLEVIPRARAVLSV